jgi:hypothetical protein
MKSIDPIILTLLVLPPIVLEALFGTTLCLHTTMFVQAFVHSSHAATLVFAGWLLAVSQLWLSIALVARKRGYDAIDWLAATLFSGPLALLVLLAAPPAMPSAGAVQAA